MKMDKQIFGDPDAADIVFTSGADILTVGLNVTHQVIFTGRCTISMHPFAPLVSRVRT